MRVGGLDRNTALFKFDAGRACIHTALVALIDISRMGPGLQAGLKSETDSIID